MRILKLKQQVKKSELKENMTYGTAYFDGNS